MFSHIQIGARDLPKMLTFYDHVLQTLGLIRIPDENDGGPDGAGWQRPGRSWPQVYVQLPFNGLPATWGNGMQVSFAAQSQQQVRDAWQAALDNGGTDEGAPGLRPQYAQDYFGAYCRDPEGNKLCFVHTSDMA
ncbi:VOC family protein [Pseudomonas coleopterorum]|uniref:VOC family protein n=1 Tax=Pseudomonas coleopterorum TaxID=1605838 RepID=UPI00089CC302|nr:VOC family protein [Pseudomonas coleopterorum]SEE62716.1 Catechol 2,3-dioxygenase [Pseudomonas coleopterorum]